MRVLWQIFSDASAQTFAPTLKELRARGFEIEIVTRPHFALEHFALVHFFGLAPLPQTLQCILNALAQHKPFVLTPTSTSESTIAAPNAEIAQHARAFETAAREFILNNAAHVFINASVENIAQTYRRLGNFKTEMQPNTLRALEDLAIESGLLTYRADAYYYSELTPQLERDAARASALESALRAEKI